MNYYAEYDRLAALRIGATYHLIRRTIPHVTILSVRPVIGSFNDKRYRVSRSYIGDELSNASGQLLLKAMG